MTAQWIETLGVLPTAPTDGPAIGVERSSKVNCTITQGSGKIRWKIAISNIPPLFELPHRCPERKWQSSALAFRTRFEPEPTGQLGEGGNDRKLPNDRSMVSCWSWGITLKISKDYVDVLKMSINAKLCTHIIALEILVSLTSVPSQDAWMVWWEDWLSHEIIVKPISLSLFDLWFIYYCRIVDIILILFRLIVC